MTDYNYEQRREASFLRKTLLVFVLAFAILSVVVATSSESRHFLRNSRRGTLFQRSLNAKGAADGGDGNDSGGSEEDKDDEPSEDEDYDPTKKYLKLNRDAYGVAERVKDMLDPYVYVEIVADGSEHVTFDLSEGTNSRYNIDGSPCDDGITVSGDINTSKQSSYDITVDFFFKHVAMKMGVQTESECDAGYLYSRKLDVSCCTAKQLTNMDETCFEGKKQNNPPCFAVPDTTPASGMKVSKVKFIVAPSLVSNGWTRADSEREIERANRLIISSDLGPSAQLRFVLHSQETASTNFGTKVPTLLQDVRSLASKDGGDGGFDVLMYLFRDTTPDDGIGGMAETGHCLSSPSAAVANVYWSDTTYHELMHLVGADHDAKCQDGYINNNDVDSGVSPCNVSRLQYAIPSYSCLDVA